MPLPLLSTPRYSPPALVRACCPVPTAQAPIYLFLQAEAVDRIAAKKKNIFEAAKIGDVELVRDHLTANPACIRQRGWRYDASQICFRRFNSGFLSANGPHCIMLLVKVTMTFADFSSLPMLT